MQQLSVCITAHLPGGVSSVHVTDWHQEAADPMVLPVPWYVALEPAEVWECFTALGGAYWLSSYAALCDVQLAGHEGLDHLSRIVGLRNLQWDAQPALPGLSVDRESF